jgi:AraC family transcriptional regulator, positive regulator of tynA and feaB
MIEMNSTVLDTVLPEVDPVLWGEQIKRAFFPFELHVDPGMPFLADAQVGAFRQYRVAEVCASAHVVEVDAQVCDRLPVRQMKILWQLRGTGELQYGARRTGLEPGQWTAYEATHPYRLSMSDNASFVVFLCDAEGEDGLAFLESRVAASAQTTEGGAAVALAVAQSMVASGTRLSRASQMSSADFITIMLCQQMQLADRHNVAPRRRTTETLLREAVQYVQQNLECPELSPDQIADFMHVSRRTLYHVFELGSETPQALVQRMRLERCREILCHDRTRGANITQLALDFGFSDPAYFTRVFRRRFGITPSQCRAAMLSMSSRA